MTRQHASTHVAFRFLRGDGLSLADVAGLILGMDQGRFEQQMPRVEQVPGRSSS
ncbi:hypothetical protein ACIQTW_00655 [Paenarthrobacter sp. NPDC090517]|uniref:hypothetical protein n=1 Tax=Paenarthrobacter sp. NPDC090517 TaxID=3364381 RepID=UPI003830CD26